MRKELREEELLGGNSRVPGTLLESSWVNPDQKPALPWPPHYGSL